MILTEQFVYLHLHKTGGTFFNEALLRYFPRSAQFGYHLPRTLIPDSHRGLPILGFVRNPWSYYVSWYSFQSQRPHPNPLFACVSNGGALGFGDTIRNLLMLGSESEHLDALLPMLPEFYTNRGLNLPRFALASIRDTKVGFFTFLYRHIFQGAYGSLHLGRSEDMREYFTQFLSEIGVQTQPALLEFLGTQPKLNVSRHAPYATYYDMALRNLVFRHDQEIIDRFGYTFSDPP